ncbi:MAG: flagellar basal body L-ring protein FlgH [Succinivibrionaceae bacterium]|nr:flagellar basal body L-ring protein FlgH [Ruminobacter sp.]MDY5779894.1 flagellar basal body L-ring protein FlgH [Succinivibrionaceae bacterium]MEE1340404.1 flagellar basal body L-ring protein FlgH [Succinivibrionaceae bacterium]
MKYVMVIFAMLLTGCAAVQEPTPDDPKFAPAMPLESVSNVVPDGSIFSNARANSLYTDIKAHRIGDIISVELDESTSAQKNASNKNSKSNSNQLNALNLGGKPVTFHGFDTTASLGSESSFDGSAKASQSNSLKGNISVSVIQVLSNGNLVVRGEKWVMLTNGNEYIRITGIVRSEDVNADNTISSQKIANARIEYGGTGDFSNSTEKGWLSKFFNSKWMPF